MIGEVDLGEAISRRNLQTKSQFKINKLNIGSIISVNSTSAGNLSLQIDKESKVSGNIKSEGELELTTNFLFSSNVLDLSDASLKTSIKNLTLIKDLVPAGASNHRISFLGELKGIGSNLPVPEFNFNFIEPIAFTIDNFTFSSNLMGKVSKNSFDLDFVSNFSEGIISGSLNSKIYNEKTGLLFHLEEDVKMNLEFRNVDLKVMSLKGKTFYSLLKQFGDRNSLNSKFKEIKIAIKNCKYNTGRVSGGGRIKKITGGLSSKDFELIYNKGKMVADFIINKDYVEGKINLTNFNLEILPSILKERRMPIGGNVTGHLSGIYSKSKNFSHDIKINLIGRDGTIEKDRSIDTIGGALMKLSPDIKLAKSANSFQKIAVVGSYNNDQFMAENLEYRDIKDELKITGTAKIFISEVKEQGYIANNSIIKLVLFDQKKNLWLKNSSLNLPQKIPLKIKRINNKWVPDLLFTINKLKK